MTSKNLPVPRVKSPVNAVVKQPSSAPVRLKTIVRRLPPNLPEAIFWQSVEPWVSDETASWKIFYQGKLRKKLNKENIPSRAYILFRNDERLAAFSREYDGHLFRDKQGIESQAVVEFAPNQKAPPEKKKADSRHATIQQDEDYLSFVTSLQNPPPKSVEVDVDALLASTQAPEQPKTTPLLAALREQKLSAHEKKIAVSQDAKLHSRKGAAAAASTQKSDIEDPSPPTGKKGRKGKGTQPGAASTPSALAAANARASGANRNRPNTSASSGVSTSGASAPSATSSTGKETTASGGGETLQKRNRPMLGLQSRHLKAALGGAGLTPPPASPLSSSLAPATPSVPAPATSNGPPPTGDASRASGRGGSEKRSSEKNKEGAARSSGSVRGSGKEKSRSRHPPGNHGPQTALDRTPDATPRILSRQDAVTTAPDAGDVRDRTTTTGSQGLGGGRGRARRGRGHS